MKKHIFIIILLFTISCALLAINYKPYAAMAQIKLETALPNIPGAPAPSSGLPEYIKYLFIFGLSLIGFLALGQMMLGGLTYILAAGNVSKVEDAKNTIQQALLGLGLLLVSYLLLRTINPDLVNLRNPNLTPTSFKGAEQSTEDYCSRISQKQCNNFNVCKLSTAEVCGQRKTGIKQDETKQSIDCSKFSEGACGKAAGCQVSNGVCGKK